MVNLNKIFCVEENEKYRSLTYVHMTITIVILIQLLCSWMDVVKNQILNCDIFNGTVYANINLLLLGIWADLNVVYYNQLSCVFNDIFVAKICQCMVISRLKSQCALFEDYFHEYWDVVILIISVFVLESINFCQWNA